MANPREAEFRERLNSYLFEMCAMPPKRYASWALIRGQGTLAILPRDVRRIIYRLCIVRWRRSIPDAIIGGYMEEGRYRCRYFKGDTPLGQDLSLESEFSCWARARLFPSVSVRFAE